MPKPPQSRIIPFRPSQPTTGVGLKERLKRNGSPRVVERPLTDEPDLIGAIAADIVDIGVVGDEDLALLIYLTASSRKLRHPLRLIIRGPSSAGKSHPLQRIAQMAPAEDVLPATGFSKQALYYGEPGWLEHKFFVKGERLHSKDDEAADITASLRQLISEGRISRPVTMKKGDGHQTVMIEQEGPIAFAETTTQESIFVEDLNRCLQVWADASPEQTRRIQR